MERSLIYNGTITAEQFLFYEIRIASKYYLDGTSVEDAIEEIKKNNLFQYPTERLVARMVRSCYKRLDALDDEQLRQELSSAPPEIAKQINLYAMMRYNRIVWDFMVGVIGEKFRSQDFEFSRKDLNVFFSHLQEQNDDNINATARDTANRAFVDRSHDFASTDISSNFEKLFGLKYYKTGADSAKQQAKSVFERFNEYKSGGGKDPLNVFLEKRGFTDDSVLHDPIYCGQVRVIPVDQLKEACAWLRQKIATESTIRPEQMERYQDTLRMLSDRLRDGQGTESIPLTEADAKALAVLAKEGDISAEKLKLLGVSADEVIHFEYLAKQAFKSGLTAATISVVLNVAPEIYKAIDHLIKSGELDEKQFQRIGFAALQGGSEGLVRGSVSAAITIACKSGMLGEALKGISPSIVGMQQSLLWTP